MTVRAQAVTLMQENLKTNEGRPSGEERAGGGRACLGDGNFLVSL
jgi:hypothetical protein